jgi:hypothetical protein
MDIIECNDGMEVGMPIASPFAIWRKIIDIELIANSSQISVQRSAA